MSVVKHLKPPNWDVGTTSASTLFVETETKQSEVISEARKIIKKDASNVWALFVYSRHKKKVQWECPLCSDPLNFGKTKSVLSLKLRVLRHLGTCHMTCRFNFEEHLFTEWRFLQDEFGKKIDIFQSVPKSVKQVEKHSVFHGEAFPRSSINFITHLDDPGLVEVFGANAFCEICCEGVLSLDHLRKHGELENKLSFSEFFQCEEKSIDEYPFPHPFLGYGCEETCSEQQTTSTGSAAYTWCCRVPSCWNYIPSSFPTITVLKAHALMHFEEFHEGLFNEALFENEWTIIHAESDLTHIDLRRQRATVMDVACPDEFVHPSTRQLIPFEYRGHRVCQFCFFTSSDEKKLRRHLRRHGYREEKKPFLHPESLDYGVPAVRELMVDFCKHLHPVHYLYGDKSVYKGQKKLWEKRKEDLELDLSHSQSTSVEFVDDAILEHLDRNQRDGENMEEHDARRDTGDDYTKEDEERVGDGNKEDHEEKELMNKMELEFDQETSDGKVVATNEKLDHRVSPKQREKAKEHDDIEDTEFDYTKEDVEKNEEEEMDDRVLKEDERMNKEDLELDKENSERTQIGEKAVEKKKDQVSVLHEKKRGKKRKEMYREGDEGEHEDEVKRNKKTCRRNQKKEQEKNNKVRKENRKLVEVPKDGKKGEVEDKPVSGFSSAMHRTPQEEEGEPEHQQELIEMDEENTLLVNHQRKPMDEEDTVLVGNNSSFGEFTIADDVVSECDQSTVTTPSDRKKVKRRVSWAPEELEASTEKCDQSVSNLEKAVVERVEEQSKKQYNRSFSDVRERCLTLVDEDDEACSSSASTPGQTTRPVPTSLNSSNASVNLVPLQTQEDGRKIMQPSFNSMSASRTVVPSRVKNNRSNVPVPLSDKKSTITEELMSFRKEGDCEFARRAIQYLLNKLNSVELDNLTNALKSDGRSSAQCVTIPRTSRGMIRFARKEMLAHVIYASIWRWPDVSSRELRKLPYCLTTRDEPRVCVNPYHYDRLSLSTLANELQAYQQKGVDHENAKKAIQYLVKKLGKANVDALLNVLKSAGKSFNQCFTVRHYSDKTIHVLGTQIFPHVLYTSIWRWPDISKGELRRLECCTTSDDQFTCINPYHYERVSPSEVRTLPPIVVELQSYQKDGADPEHAIFGIQHLVKKLGKEKTVESLLNVLKSAGKDATPCVTIRRTNRGRITIAGKYIPYHVFFVSIWRWPGISREELRRSECCTTSEGEFICINPYHYEKKVAAAGTLTYPPVVLELQKYQQGDVDPEYAKKGIQHLVDKLGSGGKVDSLKNVLKSRSVEECVTIPHTNRGRMRMDDRMVSYQALCVSIWRWPEVTHKELRKLPRCTTSRRDLICLNPFHYERISTKQAEMEVSISAELEQTTSPSENVGNVDTSLWSDRDEETEDEKEIDKECEEMRKEKVTLNTTDQMEMTVDIEELENDLYIPSGSSSPIDLNVRSVIIDSDSDEVSTDGEGYGVEKPVNEEETGSARETEGKQKRIENNVPEEPSPKRRRRSVQQRTQKETSVRDEEEESAEKNRCSLKNTPRRVVKSPSVNVDPVLLSHRRNGRSGKLFDMSPPSRESIGKEKGADSERKK